MTVPPPPAPRDLDVLIGVLAELEGAVRAGDLPLEQGLRLRRRFVDAGLLTPHDSYVGLAAALAALNQRLRAYEQPTTAPRHELVENAVAFPDAGTARAFVDRLRGDGRDVDDAVHEEGLRRWTVVVRLPTWDDELLASDAGAGITLGGWHLGAS